MTPSASPGATRTPPVREISVLSFKTELREIPEILSVDTNTGSSKVIDSKSPSRSSEKASTVGPRLSIIYLPEIADSDEMATVGLRGRALSSITAEVTER